MTVDQIHWAADVSRFYSTQFSRKVILVSEIEKILKDPNDILDNPTSHSSAEHSYRVRWW